MDKEAYSKRMNELSEAGNELHKQLLKMIDDFEKKHQTRVGILTYGLKITGVSISLDKEQTSD